MKKLLRWLTGMAVAAGCAGLTGCAWLGENERPADITLEELLASRQRAADPSGAFAHAGSFVQRQVVTVPHFFAENEKYLLETRFLKPDHFQLTTLRNNRPAMAVLYNGQNAWRVDYVNRTVTPIEEPELSVLRTVFVFGVPDGDLFSVFARIDLTSVTVGGEEFYKLHCVPRCGDVPGFDLYIDSASFLTKMIRTTESADGVDIKYSATIDNYGNYGDVMIPDHCSIRQGDGNEETQVVQFELNVQLKETDFLPPKF